jgi:hypothetical protein
MIMPARTARNDADRHLGDRQSGSYSQINLLWLIHPRRTGATTQTKHADTIARARPNLRELPEG